MPNFKEGDTIQIVEAQGVPPNLIGATGVVVSVAAPESAGTHQDPESFPRTEQWEQLYDIRLDRDGETMLAPESWLRLV